MEDEAPIPLLILSVYILQSLKDHRTYIGSTDSLERRFKQHNSGKSKSTKYRAPFKLLFKEEFESGNEAKKGLPGLFDSLFRIVTPLIYLYLWYAIPASIFGKENVDIIALTVSALPVIFIGVISRQTNWSIGGKKGIKGDNIGRKVRATVDRRGSFEFEGIDMDGEKAQTHFIKNN